jgi:hypothetical protein
MLKQVTVSGTVGKQVVPTNGQAVLHGVMLTPSGANASVKIRDGNASGEVVFFAKSPSASTHPTIHIPVSHNFTRGMHVKVLGTGADAYLDIS